jgi:hypothetical protein
MKKINPQDASKYYSDLEIFRLLLDSKFEEFNCLLIEPKVKKIVKKVKKPLVIVEEDNEV